MPSYVPSKRATEFIFYVSLVSRADTKLFQNNPTIAAGDFLIITDGNATTNLDTLPVVTPTSSDFVKITVSVAEMTGDNISIVASDAAGAEWCDQQWNIQTAVRQIDDLAFPSVSGRNFIVETDGMVHVDVKEWLGVAPLALIAQRVAVNAAVVGDKTGYTLTIAEQDAIIDKVFDEDIVAAHGTADTAGLLLRALGALISQRTNNPTLNALLGVTDAAGEDVPSQTTDEVLDEAVSGHVGAGSIGNLIERLDIIAAGGTGGLTDARAVLLDNLDQLVSANATPAEVLTQVNAALDAAISELSQGQPSATPSIRNAVMLLYMALAQRLDTNTSGTDELAIYNSAGTKIVKKLLTDASGDYSEARAISGA